MNKIYGIISSSSRFRREASSRSHTDRLQDKQMDRSIYAYMPHDIERERESEIHTHTHKH